MTESPPSQRGWTTRLGAAHTTLAAVLGLLGAGLTVLFLLVPSLKPLPRDRIGVTVAVDDIQNVVTLRQWASWQYPDDTDAHLATVLGRPYDPRRDRDGVGTVVYVRLTTVGFQHRSVRLRLQVLSAATGEESSTLSVKQQYPTAASIDVRDPSLNSVQLLYIDSLLGLIGDVVIRVTAYDGDGVLAYADSSVIRNGRIVGEWRHARPLLLRLARVE